MNTNVPLIQMPPPILHQPPAGRASRWRVIGFSAGGVLFFLFNVFLALLNIALRQQHMMLITFIGYVFGNIVLPAGAIIGIACCWKSNRRPYTLLRWFFWIMVGMLVVKLLGFLPLLVDNAMKHRATN